MSDAISTFLRYVQANCNDVAPTQILGPESTAEQRATIMRFARGLYDRGLIEPTMRPAMGPDGDLLRVRVTEAGEDYLRQHED